MIKLSKNQITNTLIILFFVKLFFTFPRQMVLAAGNSAWLLAVFLTLAGLFLFWILQKVYNSDRDILDIAEDVGGKPFKIITGLISSVIILLNITAPSRIFMESVQVILLQETPIELTTVFFALSVIIGAFCGIEALSIICGLFLPIVIGVLVFFLILLFPNLNINNLTPFLGTGAKQIFVNGAGCISMFSDIYILFFLIPFFKEKGKTLKIGYKAIIVSGIALFLIVFFYGAIFPYPVSTEYIMPVYHLTRIVGIGDFFGRLEAFFEFVWAISVFLHISINVYILSLIWQKSFNLKYYRPIAAPMIILVLAIGFMPSSVVDVLKKYGQFRAIATVFAFFTPLLFGVLSRIRNKK